MSFARVQRFAQELRAGFSYPLLAKELAETAARRRTYLLRVIYAVALYALFALMLPANAWTSLTQSGAQPGDLQLLGVGGTMFETLTSLQFMGVLLFLPALMCGRITQEKERDSLILLFLTELKPWDIVLQKYLGGLVTMLSFFLLGLPLTGIAYAFGGLESGTIFMTLFDLVLTSCFVGAFALFCSAWCRSTVGAFVMTYVVGALPIWIVVGMGTEARIVVVPLASMFFLARARKNLVPRALVPPVNFLRPMFERLDETMKQLNRVTGGVVLWNEAGRLPTDDPVFWRETHGKVLGKLHYLLRLLCFIEIPTIFLCLFAIYDRSWGDNTQFPGLSWLLAFVAALSALLVSVQAANSIVSERVGQSLEVLLTTPLSARDIIRQKERALWRIVIMAAVPLITVIVSEAYSEVDSRIPISAGTWVPYLVCGLSQVIIYLPLIVWLSLWISLRVRTRFQAIITAVGTLTAWSALAPLLSLLAERQIATHSYNPIIYSPVAWRSLVLLSPVSMGYLNEFNQLQQIVWSTSSSPWIMIILNAVFYGWIALFFRWRLYANAESLLRR